MILGKNGCLWWTPDVFCGKMQISVLNQYNTIGFPSTHIIAYASRGLSDTIYCRWYAYFHKYWSCGYRMGTFLPRFGHSIHWFFLFCVNRIRYVTTSLRCATTRLSVASPPRMMTSSNGSILRVTGLLCGEFTGHRWIPHTKASDGELWCFLWS